MRTFAQKPTATQQSTSARSTMAGRAHFGQGREVNARLHFQGTIGNRAVQQMIQRELLRENRNCNMMTGLPIVETATVQGVHHTKTFSRPTSGKIKVVVTTTNGDEKDCTFGVNVWQCHIVTPEPIEQQRIGNVGATISYEISLPVEKWNTYDKFALRIRVNCQADLDVKVSAA